MFGNSAKFTLKLGLYYFLLYFFTVVYNISNKKLLLSFPFPLTVATTQTLIGIPMFLPIWALKSPKNIWNIDRARYFYSACCHAWGNVATVYALYAGSVSFTHIVKAAEPLFTAALSLIVMKSKLSVEAYVTLIPIVIGVAVASAKEVSFSWTSLCAAMASNFFYQLRMVLSKLNLTEPESSKLSPGNAFRVVTLLSFAILLPFALILEGDSAYRTMVNIQRRGELGAVLQDILTSGASFYLYNEISFWILDLVHPVTLAVGNAIKRVVLIAAAIMFFHSPMDPIGAIGAAVAVGGSFMYAIASQRQANKSQSLPQFPSNSTLSETRSLLRP